MNAFYTGRKASGGFSLFNSGRRPGSLRARLAVAVGTIALAARTVGAAPANDYFTNALALTGAASATSGSTTGATKETGEPALIAGNVGGASVWFRWVAPASGTVVFSTEGSSFDTLLAVYTGTNIATLNLAGANDDIQAPDRTSAVTFAAAAGTEYRIAVDGYNGVSGNYILRWLYPVVKETVLSTAVTNVSNFVYDSDALYGGTTNRDKLLVTSSVASTNLSPILQASTYVLSYRLLNTNNAPHPILDASGATNAAYTYNVTNQIVIGAFSTVTSTTPAALKPAVPLDPYTEYWVELKIDRLGSFTGAMGSNAPNIYLEFTNLTSPDPALNTIPYQFSSGWVQTYAIQTAPGQTAFAAGTFLALFRYDNFGQPSPTTNNVTVYINYELRNASNGALIPLKNSATNFVHAAPSFTAGTAAPPTPNSVAVVSATDTFLLEPVTQIDSVNFSYYVVAHLAIDNGLGPPYVNGNTLQSSPTQLLGFNGNVFFGSIGTTLTSLGSAPPTNSPSGGMIPTTLNTAAGYVSAAPDHTYAGAGPLNVNLDTLGNAYVTAGSVTLSAPAPDKDSIARVNYQRGPVTLTPAGGSANMTATLPAGFGYRTGDVSSPVVQGSLFFSSVALSPALAPSAAVMTYLPGSTVYAAEESKPSWLVSDRIHWRVNAGTFDLPNATAMSVRANAFAYLQSVSNNLVDPPAMGDKRSNDHYWESLIGLASDPVIGTDAGSNALLSTIFNFSAGGFRAHFPYDTLVEWTGLGSMKVVDDMVPVGGGSLNGAGVVSVPYSQGCPDCGPSGGGTATPFIAITNGLFSFTPDGGLVALGTSAGIDLKWGYIPSIPAFAQQALNFTDAAFHMPGVFLRGDQNTLPAVQRATTLLYTGFAAANLNVVERPLSSGYSAGLADYAGLNFRCVTDGAHTAISTIAGTTGIHWQIDARSKYYARYAGVSGIHEAVPGSFPANLTLWGYKFTFTSYGLSYLDSQNKDSVTDGAVSLPYPAQFVQGFNDMTFSCLGSPLGGDIPPGEPFKVMAYWLADFKTHSIQFKTANSCAPNDGGYLVLGIEGYASHVPSPLYGQVGFFNSGDQIPPAFGLPGVSSRLKAPNIIKIGGPNNTTYSFTTVQDAYYNVWSNSPAGPTAGWLSFYGDMGVPFFKNLQLHLQTSCHTNGVASSNAPIYLSGGWPRPGSGNPNYGWLDASARSPFETNVFDYPSQGWPGGTLDIATYRDDPTDQKWHPRAQRLWLGVIDFDYPLSWDTSLRSFKSWQEVKNDLLVINVQHQIKYMDAKRAEIDFGAQYEGLPTISIANLAFNAIDEATGVGDAIVKAASQPVEDVLSAGLDEMDQMLNAQMKQLMDGVFDKTVNPVIDSFYAQLSHDWASAWSSLPVSQRQQFLLSVSTNTLFYFVGGGSSQAATTLTSSLRGLANGVNQADNLIGRVEGYLQDATNAIQSVVGVLSMTTNGTSLGSNVVGLVAQDGSGGRPVVPKLLQSLVGDIAPQFIDAVIGPTVSNLLHDIEPELAEITDTLQQTEAALSLVSSNLGTAGQFTLEMSNILASASGELSNISFSVSMSVTQYFGQLDYNIDNPFTHISPTDIKNFIRQKVEDQFFASTAASQIQTALRQRLYDVDAAMKSQVDSVFQQLNGMLRDLISQSLAELDDTINKTLGGASDVIGAGKINGHALIDGDSLKELRIDGHFQFKVPDDMELDAFLLIKELNSDGSSGCSSGNAPATEVTIGATKIPVGWLSSDLTADLEAKFTFDGTHPFPVNLGGQIALNGELDFETFQLHDLAAALAFGEFENYLALKGGVRFNGFDFSGAIFFGRTCSLDPLILIDPEVAKVVGNPPFTGAYCYAQGWLPVSQLVLGIPASCIFEISAGVGAGAFYFAEGPTYGGKMFLGVSGSLLCIVSIEGDITMIGVKHGADMNFDGHGHFEASLGPCPFCISISKDVDVSYVNNSWSIH